MPRQRSPARDKAFEIYKGHSGNISNREIANLLNEDEKKIAVWKQRDKWNNNVVQQLNESCTTKDRDEVSWIAIENKYVTDMRKKPCSLESLSKIYNIPIQTIKDYSASHEWSKKRTEYKLNTNQKIREKSSEGEVDRNLKYLEVSDRALNAVEEYFKNKHYKKHVIKYKIYVDGKPIKDELVNIELDVADTKALANMVTSLEKIQKGQRLSEGLDKENNTVDIIKESNDRISTLASLINNPAPNRQIQDFEDENED
jgi:phage terminase small subunit